ncbi:hypothetical protein EYC59_00135 [Candidatus Saccharibacteria bacterium]|nr:MAG: hypothetical protein EYC59_00135 [Candidatus Saccharibacteria bacterium]
MVREQYFEAYPEGLPVGRFRGTNPETAAVVAPVALDGFGEADLRATSTGDAWGQGSVEDLKPNTSAPQQ